MKPGSMDSSIDISPAFQRYTSPPPFVLHKHKNTHSHFPVQTIGHYSPEPHFSPPLELLHRLHVFLRRTEEGISYRENLGNCLRRQELPDAVLQSRCHYQCRIPREQHPGHPVPPVVHLCPPSIRHPWLRNRQKADGEWCLLSKISINEKIFSCLLLAHGTWTLSLFEDSVEKARIKFEDFVILGRKNFEESR